MPKTHGLSGKNKRLYKIWKEMRYRCNNPNNKSYPRYGGRGITVCKEWDNSFVPFYEWSVANGYKEDIAESGRNRLSIDRIDNNGNYSPDNCRWVDDFTQALNKRDNLTAEEKTCTCPVCNKTFFKTKRARRITCSRTCARKYYYMNHPNNKDYTKKCPICGKNFIAKDHYDKRVYCSYKCANIKNSPIWEFEGECHRVVEWSEIIGINAHCLLRRKEMGWTIEEILTTPLRGKRNAKKL